MRANRNISDVAWRRLRAATLDRDSWTCGDCGRKGARFEVHHQNGNPADNRLANLITLCRNCHQLHHFNPPPVGRAEWDTYLNGLSAGAK